jgi:drug/metabolite transporter (DMT)-like permease
MSVGLMALASLIVPITDAIAKFLTSSLSPFYIAFARYVIAGLIVLAVTSQSLNIRDVVRFDFKINALRTGLGVATLTCFFFAIGEVSLATAFGGFFLGPCVAAVLATPVLGERFIPMRLLAAAAGLIGAYIIVRPDVNITIGSLLAMLSGLLFAGYLLATRLAASATHPIDALRFQCIFGALLLSPFAILKWAWPTGQELMLLASMGLISALYHFMIITAFRHAEAAVLSPLVYLELVTATLLGFFFFMDSPPVVTLVGICFVMGSGLLIWLADRNGATV